MNASRTWKRPLLLAALCAGLAFAAWRIVAHSAADILAGTDPQGALAWIPGHPDALLALAERQLADGRVDQAADTARRLLARAPLEGRAWRILAQYETARGHTDEARRHYIAAIRSSPHDIAARAWLLRDHLAHQRYTDALAEIDRILRISPRLGRTLVPILAQMAAADPTFADALVPLLSRQPRWRAPLLREIQSGKHPQAERVLGQLQRAGDLSPAEHQGWIEALMARRHWDEAYANWTSILPADARLSPVFNGDFGRPIGGYGFDWRIARVPGVNVDIRPDADPRQGMAARVRFNHRPAAHAGLQQALLLAPGRYRFQVRMRAEALRSDAGLEWVLLCAKGGHGLLGASERIQGTFGWTTMNWTAEVPENCPGQWLRLRNPVPSGIGQYVSGEVWIDDVSAKPETTR
ncbi:hypothetical protein B1992_04150 [Pseudoxanthomonas broegbernensis]|uniref:Tetratricopeptide repeat protein n=1 Tax=Pseudoxanthomonas broegbernensis TaxID=83619 RepID=A0A7V8GNL2_9GAMM|nr:tetratricopeptide repeat protein [Pseudoxanthomonas broegbernensis]KAF1687188.1 hypothetical protein B1992_04150 [Pseudoxanthomonas broegbernensis]MBB6065831.1 tetratricopeptide (TPR) repeat protein [Pseudoxanthomonas broegbernensis]